MTRRAFLPVISALIFWGTNQTLPAMPLCHDDYSAGSFEEAGEELEEFIDEYFTADRLPFLPDKSSILTLGLRPRGNGLYQKENALAPGGGHRHYPVQPGLWKAIDLGSGIWEYHLLIREPQQLAETEAFNTCNDLLGDPFADYDDPAYGMTLLPEDIRRQFAGHYFTLNVTVYGVRGDATGLLQTVTDITLTDYTPWVQQNETCRLASPSHPEKVSR